MIAIPNMDMPETCDMCPIEGCEYINGKFTCPLIDIVRCKDCKYYDTESRTFPCCTDIYGAVRYMEADGFCSYGERRTETLDERIKRGLKEWKEK